MLARSHLQGNTQPLPDNEAAKKYLHDMGWSYRTAAFELGVHYTHLYRVLAGKRTSKSLLHRIYALPYRQGK